MTEDKPEVGCRCAECADIHFDFIAHAGRWPNKTHEEGQAMKAARDRREAKWAKVLGEQSRGTLSTASESKAANGPLETALDREPAGTWPEPDERWIRF